MLLMGASANFRLTLGTGCHSVACVLLAIGLLLPEARAADTSAIVGILAEPGAAAAVAVVDRATDQKYAGTFDPTSGKFTVEGLPRGARYDCLIDYRDGSRLEGINLKVPPADYEEEQPLSVEDVAAITRQVRALNKFEDEVEVLAVAGNIQHASVLINKLRTRPFVNSKPGEVVWRAELWHFERPEETWVKSQDELFLVLYRQRIPSKEYARKSVTFDPALGGIAITDERPAAIPGPVRRPPATPGIRVVRRAEGEPRGKD